MNIRAGPQARLKAKADNSRRKGKAAEQMARRPNSSSAVTAIREFSSPSAFEALLRGTGFTGATARELSWEHLVDPERWWEEVYLSRVGSNGVVIARQDAATVARIKTEYDRLVSQYAVDGGQVALPAVAVLASGSW